MTIAKQIENALKHVRDTKETIAIGPYTFSYEFDRGMARCRIIKVQKKNDRLFGDFIKTSQSGFAFVTVSLPRMAKALANDI